MKNIMIKNLYAGKPDAKDEINTQGFEDFVSSYVLPVNFDIEKLTEETYYFITGYKGTGKTALLFYLDNYIKEKDIASCSSFIFFKEEFTDTKKQELEYLSKRLLSSISFTDDILLDGNDYEYIWRWILFSKIIEDNELYDNVLFTQNREWDMFVRAMSRIVNPNRKKQFIVPPKLKISMPFDPTNPIQSSADLELDFQSNNKTPEAYKQFVNIIDEAEDALKQVRKSDVPYHLFIDELEAYYGDEEMFKRDLRLIRDLLFTVKRINTIFINISDVKTKIICAVRTEIINAINRFIVTKELNKIVSGFEVPLIWDYNNTNSFMHPIIRILLKRIELTETTYGLSQSPPKLIYTKWFPEHINQNEPANYILNNGWSKPRDIVRLILAAQNCMHNNSNVFSQAVFDACQKRYSQDSLTEIKEELRALYTPNQIDNIINCFTGFRTIISLDQLRERITKYYNNTILSEKLNEILNDLYRLGIIGNYSYASKSYRWQHRGDDGLIISDEWSMIVHPALQNALSISARHDKGVERYKRITPQIQSIVSAKVLRIVPNYLLVEFDYEGVTHKGSIHISKLSHDYIQNISDFYSAGDIFQAQILSYDDNYKNWRLTLLLEE